MIKITFYLRVESGFCFLNLTKTNDVFNKKQNNRLVSHKLDIIELAMSNILYPICGILRGYVIGVDIGSEG